jgi:hypothetical protein
MENRKVPQKQKCYSSLAKHAPFLYLNRPHHQDGWSLAARSSSQYTFTARSAHNARLEPLAAHHFVWLSLAWPLGTTAEPSSSRPWRELYASEFVRSTHHVFPITTSSALPYSRRCVMDSDVEFNLLNEVVDSSSSDDEI